MPCFHPITAYKSINLKKNGKSVIYFKNAPWDSEQIQVPCGQCIGCRLNRSGSWSVRIMHEAARYEHNCFITLTYDDEHLPDDNTLVVRDFQLFMKRLRKDHPDRIIRFFHCGEYGEEFGRPHYHACIFNLDFADKVLHAETNGNKRYTSELLTWVWGKGLCEVGSLTKDSAAYCARYIMKKVNGENAFKHYCDFDEETGEVHNIKKPEYTTMSRRPGIGKHWFDKFNKDVFPSDEVIIDGKPISPPKYYDTQYELIDPEGYHEIKLQRKKRAESLAHDNTPERLAVKKQCLLSRTKTLKRPLK